MPTFIRRFWPILFLALIPLIPLWRCVFLGEAIGPFDQIRQMAPWNGPKPSQPWDVVQADGVLQFYPWRDMVLKSWSHGQPPLWNPYEFAGAPLLANSQSGGFYPPHILLGLAHVPTGWAMTLLAWFHLFWAGFGIYFLARRFGATKEGGAIGGACFQLSAFMLAWTGLPSVISTVSWIPWAMAATAMLFMSSEGRVKHTALLALSVGMMMLAGHLQFAAYGMMAVTLVAVSLLVARAKEGGLGKPILTTFAGCVLGVAMAAPQLLPVLNFGQFSHRKNTPTAEGYGHYNESAIKPYILPSIVYTQLQGYPDESVTPPGGTESYSAYWPAFAQRGANYAETAIGIGPVAMLLLFTLRRRDWKAIAPIAVVGCFGFLLATGSGLGQLLYYYFPGWSSTGSPGRAASLFVLGTCTMAACAVRVDAETDRKLLTRLWPLLGFVAFLGLTKILNVVSIIGLGGDAKTIGLLSRESHTALLSVVTLLVFGCAAFYIKAGRPLLLLGAVIGASLLAPAFNLRTGNPELTTAGPADQRIAIVNGPWGLSEAAPALLPPNLASLSGIHELSGYDSLLHRDTWELVKGIDGQDPAPPANGNIMFVKSSASPQGLAEAGVTEVWSRRELPQLGAPNSSDGGVLKYKIEGPGRVSTPQGPGKVVAETLSSLKVHATGPGKLIARERNMPGWSVSVDGKPAVLEGTTWREVELPAGEHDVEFTYSPPGMTLGLTLGVPAWLGMIAMFALGRKRDATAERPAQSV